MSPRSHDATADRLTEQRVVRETQQQHATRVRHSRPVVEASWGVEASAARPFYSHIDTNAKRAQRDAERAESIGLENRLLLERMSRAMTSKQASVLETRLVPSFAKGAPKALPSRASRRRRELTLLDVANSQMLQRLQATTSSYPRVKLARERQAVEGYLKNIGDYSYPAPIRTIQPISSLPALGLSRTRPPDSSELSRALPRFAHLLPPGSLIPALPPSLPAITNQSQSRAHPEAGAEPGGSVVGEGGQERVDTGRRPAPGAAWASEWEGAQEAGSQEPERGGEEQAPAQAAPAQAAGSLVTSPEVRRSRREQARREQAGKKRRVSQITHSHHAPSGQSASGQSASGQSASGQSASGRSGSGRPGVAAPPKQPPRAAMAAAPASPASLTQALPATASSASFVAGSQAADSQNLAVLEFAVRATQPSAGAGSSAQVGARTGAVGEAGAGSSGEAGGEGFVCIPAGKYEIGAGRLPAALTHADQGASGGRASAQVLLRAVGQGPAATGPLLTLRLSVHAETGLVEVVALQS
ncbi:hypothetical protein T492DRAFT_1069690 [Pavlovales sp. CCMP2436]|nr:hypothetical protein T492DRAFT_1069690 [Pavlovales sp. CCMP2436]